jgi:hypothetical protein
MEEIKLMMYNKHGFGRVSRLGSQDGLVRLDRLASGIIKNE